MFDYSALSTKTYVNMLKKKFVVLKAQVSISAK